MESPEANDNALRHEHTFGGTPGYMRNRDTIDGHIQNLGNQSPRSNVSQGTIHNTAASVSLVNGDLTNRGSGHNVR